LCAERLESRSLLDATVLALPWPTNPTDDGATHSHPDSQSLSAAVGTWGPAEGESAGGAKSQLLIRVRFLDRTFDASADFSETALRTRMAEIDQFYRRNSFGQTSYPDNEFDIVPGTVTIPLNLAQLNDPSQTPDINDTIQQQARQLATGMGYDLSHYDTVAVLFPNMTDGGRIGYGGLGTISGQNLWLHNTIAAGVWAHELGHNLGAGHSGFWEPNDPWAAVSLPGAGTQHVYGNALDLMGSGDLAAGEFSAYWKTSLGWLTAGTQTITVTASGTYPLYALDEGTAPAGRTYGLQIRRNDGQEYWLEHRTLPTDPTTDNGLVFNVHQLGPSAVNEDPALLDMTPGSRPGTYEDDRGDAPLPLGRTFSDWDAKIHVTPLVRHEASGSDFVDVVINLGDFPSNRAPAAHLTNVPVTAEVGQPMPLAAEATDADDDPLALYWDFGDGTTAAGSLSLAHAWATAGEYPVRFSASDMKGGHAELAFVIRVGPQGANVSHRDELDATVNAYTAQAQEEADVASNGRDRFVAVWQSQNQDGDGWGIFAQQYLADGTPAGGELPVNTTTAGDQTNPAVAMTAADDFVVVWQGAGSGDDTGIYAQRFDHLGAPQGGEVQVNTATFGTQQDPAVAVDPASGDFVVAWSSNVVGQDIRFRQYAADGTPKDSEERTAPGGRHFSGVDVAAGTDGSFVLVWDNDTGEEGGTDAAGQAVFALRFDGTGTPAATVRQLNTTTAGDQHVPRIAAAPDGGFTVVWESTEQDGDGAGVVLRNLGPDGVPVGGEVLVNTTTATDQSSPALAIDSRGRRLVTWRDGRENYVSDTDGNNAHRLFDAAGTPLTAEQLLPGVQTDFFSGPAVAALSDSSRYVIVNPEYRDADETDVRAHFFTLSAPIAVGADTATVARDQAIDLDVLSNDSQLGGGPLWLALHHPPSFGTVVVLDGGTPNDPADDRLRYAPRAGFVGTESFMYQVTDAIGATALGAVTVQVGMAPANTVPVARDDALVAETAQPLLVGWRRLLANDEDGDEDPLSLVEVGQPSHGTLTDLGDGAFLYTSESGFTGTDSLTYEISDGRGGSAAAAVDITVAAGAGGLAPRDLLIYYGYPSALNGAADIAAAAAEFGRYRYVVLAAGLESATHPDHASTAAIMAHPNAAGTRFFGYVDLGVTTQNLSMAEIQERIALWRAMGAAGILLDDFGYDFETPRSRQNDAVAYAHGWGLPVIANGFFVEQVLGDAIDAAFNPDGQRDRLTAADFYLYESLQVSTGSFVEPSDWQAKASLLNTYQESRRIRVLAVTTNDATNAYDAGEFFYAWYSALLYGYEAMGWGEYEFAAETGLASYRERPSGSVGSRFVRGVGNVGPMFQRDTDVGRVRVDTATHSASFALFVPWQNPLNSYDVDGVNGVQPIDVLLIIDYINNHPNDPSLPAPPASPPPYLDVNGDGLCTAQDVLQVIDEINNPTTATDGEGEPTPIPTAVHAAAPAPLVGLAESPRAEAAEECEIAFQPVASLPNTDRLEAYPTGFLRSLLVNRLRLEHKDFPRRKREF
jgi:hypothetical protein